MKMKLFSSLIFVLTIILACSYVYAGDINQIDFEVKPWHSINMSRVNFDELINSGDPVVFYWLRNHFREEIYNNGTRVKLTAIKTGSNKFNVQVIDGDHINNYQYTFNIKQPRISCEDKSGMDVFYDGFYVKYNGVDYKLAGKKDMYPEGFGTEDTTGLYNGLDQNHRISVQFKYEKGMQPKYHTYWSDPVYISPGDEIKFVGDTHFKFSGGSAWLDVYDNGIRIAHADS